MSCPWAKIESPQALKLEDIMSEELARELQAKEEMKYALKLHAVSLPPGDLEIPQDLGEATTCSEEMKSAGKPHAVSLPPGDLEIPQDLAEATTVSDEEIAKMLQKQYDKEHDEWLKRSENKLNGASKISVSFENYRRAPLNDDFDSASEEEEIEDIRDRKNWDRFDVMQKEIDSIPACGYRKTEDGNMITKHDITINGRKNACRMMSFPPDFQTGDGESFDMKISNKVLNSLKIHAKNVESKKHKFQDKREDQATAEFGLDEYTRLLLYKLHNNNFLEQVNGIISIGKEAVILHATCDPTYEKEKLPEVCAIKVHKTTLADFKKRDIYIKDDNRFRDKIGKQSTKKCIPMWAEKEMANLCRLAKADIPCPKVLFQKKHVLIMSFIGENNTPAPKLKHAVLNEAECILAYEMVVQAMKNMYDKAKLIHADLSEYNILWCDDQCYFIDVGQSVEPCHENAFQFLMRDCNNITHFFQRKGVPNMCTPEELFQDITGYAFTDRVGLSEVQKTFKMQPHFVNNPTIEIFDKFEEAWEDSMLQKRLETKEQKANKVERAAEEKLSALTEPLRA